MRREAVPCERVMVVVSAGQGAEPVRVSAERYKSKCRRGMYTKRFSSRPVTTGSGCAPSAMLFVVRVTGVVSGTEAHWRVHSE